MTISGDFDTVLDRDNVENKAVPFLNNHIFYQLPSCAQNFVVGKNSHIEKYFLPWLTLAVATNYFEQPSLSINYTRRSIDHSS